MGWCKFPASNEDIQDFEEIFTIRLARLRFLQLIKKTTADRITTLVKTTCNFNPLRIDDSDGYSHYDSIEDYSRLMGSRTNKHKAN